MRLFPSGLPEKLAQKFSGICPKSPTISAPSPVPADELQTAASAVSNSCLSPESPSGPWFPPLNDGSMRLTLHPRGTRMEYRHLVAVPRTRQATIPSVLSPGLGSPTASEPRLALTAGHEE